MRRLFLIALVLLPLLALGEKRVLKLGTTTSAAGTGLLDYLLPMFEARTGVKVHYIAEGTGKSLKSAEDGNVDLVLVHAPDLEAEFVAKGFGVNRVTIMRNDFIIVGPAADPAGVRKAKTLEAALRALKGPKGVFISRADNSGTHVKEMELWKLVGGPPPAARRLEIGQGMEQALRMAADKQAYTLTDRSSFMVLKKTLDLVMLFSGDPRLANPYSVIATNPSRWPKVNSPDAKLLIDWLSGPEGQAAIAGFKKDGEQLFQPVAKK